MDTATYNATLSQIRLLARDTYLYRLELEQPLRFQAGQFVNLKVPGAKPRGERSYSIYSDPQNDQQIELCIKLFEGGAASEYLRASKEGDTLQIRGPFGVFTLPQTPDPVHFIATATGLAPFRSMLMECARLGDARSFRMCFGVRSQADLFAAEDLAYFAEKLDFSYKICLSAPADDWDGFHGRVSAAIAEAPKEGHWYLCGNGNMVEEVRGYLKGCGMDRKQIHVEKYY